MAYDTGTPSHPWFFTETSKTVQFAYLNGIVSIKEHFFGADAAVDAAHGHI